MYKFGLTKSAGDKEYAKGYAESLALSRAGGYGIYKIAKKKAEGVLVRRGVDPLFWGLYKAFVNELVHKVFVRGTDTVEAVINAWSRQGLDPGVLAEIAESLAAEVVEVPEAPPRG
ncbi:MAG: hypothetical protein DRH17_12885 [Deltaproteobacteria bacterium]|nr:MAG: hypothetical protein DRH17_12885 [Deltaproteobacteria bacterium]